MDDRTTAALHIFCTTLGADYRNAIFELGLKKVRLEVEDDLYDLANGSFIAADILLNCKENSDKLKETNLPYKVPTGPIFLKNDELVMPTKGEI